MAAESSSALADIEVELTAPMIRRIAFFAALLLLGLGLADLLQGQTPAGTGQKFTARSELVTVPVIVADKSGAHIQNLKKEDFVVTEDGEKQTIAVFEEITRSPEPVHRVPVQPQHFSNAVAMGSRVPPRLTIIVLDTVNTPFEDQAYARSELIKFLADSVRSREPTALLTIGRSGMKVIHDFTTDPAVLTAALKKVKGGPQPLDQASQEELPNAAQVGDAMAKLLEFMRHTEQMQESFERRVSIMTTLQAMQQIAQAYAGVPGRKALIWASAGFPFSINPLSMTLKEVGPLHESRSDVVPLYEKTWRALNQAQIAVYPVDVRGLVNTSYVGPSIGRAGSDYYDYQRWLQGETISSFQAFAEATGGRAAYNGNDLKGAFQKVADDNATYYLLGYYLDRRGKKPGWRKLDVKVHRDGAYVRSRSGFFLSSPASDAQDSARGDVGLALGSPLDYTGIQITGQWEQIQAAKGVGKKKVTFLLSMPAHVFQVDEDDHNHVVVDFAAVARTETGAPGGDMSQTLDAHLRPESLDQVQNHGMDYRGSLIIAPGEYSVRFVVRDRLSGRMGSVLAPLKVTP